MYYFTDKLTEISDHIRLYLLTIDDDNPIIFPDNYEQGIRVIEYDTYEEDCTFYYTKAKKVFSDHIIDIKGDEYLLYQLDIESLALIADRVSELKDKRK